MSFENESESTEFEPLNETETFDEAVALIEKAAGEDRSESTEDKEPETVNVDDPERAAKGLIRAGMGAINFLLKIKEPRIQYSEEKIRDAENNIAPALVKHGVGSKGVTKFGEEANAAQFLFMLGIETRSAIAELRAEDEAKRKAAEEAAQHG